MTADVLSSEILALGTDGATAPPRANGELTFGAPWESRSFAMAVSLAEQGVFTLAEFQQHLIEVIARWEDSNGDDEPYHYYHRWQEALESVLASKKTVPETALHDRVGELVRRPHGHDHRHDHDHGHDHDHDHSH